MKKKLIFVLIILVIIASAIGITSYINSKTHNKGPVSAFGYTTTTLDKPTDGTTLEDYNNYDNLAIVAGLMTKSDFHGVTTGEVTAKVAFINYKQDVYNIRTIIGDEGFQQAISTSSLKSVAIQKYFSFNEEKVLTRNPDKINGKDTTWLNETPSVYSNKQYLDIYGWLPNQISSYILCKESIIEISDVFENEKGYNQIDLVLDVSIAPANYQYEVKAYGGSSDFPSFSSIKLSIIFDDDWQLQQIDSTEVYDITMPVIGSITCTARMTEVFTYDNLEIEAKSFFDQYQDLKPSDNIENGEQELKPLDYFMYAFGSYLNGQPLYIDLDLNINDHLIKLNCAIDLVNNTYSITNQNLNILVKNDDVYLNYANLKLKTQLSKLSTLLDFAELDTDDLMNQIAESVITRQDDKVLMNTNLELMGLKLPILFTFEEKEDNVKLNSIESNFKIDDLNIGVNANLVDSGTFYNDDFTNYQDLKNLNFIIQDLKEIINNKSFVVNINYNKDNIKINGEIKAQFSDKFAIKGKLNLIYNNIDLNVDLIMIDNVCYLDVSGFKFTFNIDSLNLATNDLSLTNIIDFIFNFKLAEICKNLVINQDGLQLDLNIIDRLYNLKIKDLAEGFNISSEDLGLDITITNKAQDEVINKPEGSYYDITTIIENFDNIYAIFTNDYINVKLLTNINIANLNIPVNLEIVIDLEAGLIVANGTIEMFGSKLNIEAQYKDGNIYIQLGNNLIFKLTLTELLTYIPSFDLDLSFINEFDINIFEDEIEISNENLTLNNITITNTKLNITKGNEIREKNYEVDLVKSDLDNIINVINKVIVELQDNIEINGKYQDINFNVIIDKSFNIEAKLNVLGIDLEIKYYEGNIYITYNGINIKTNITEVIELINKYIGEIKLELDLNNIIEVITTSPNKINLKALGLDLEIDVEDKISISEKSKGIDLILSSTEKRIKEEPQDYILLNTLIPYVDLILEQINNQYLNLKGNTTINIGNIESNVVIDLNIDIKNIILEGKINLGILGKEILVELYYKDNNLIVKLGNNLVLELSKEEIISYLSEIKLDMNNLIKEIKVEEENLKLNILGYEIKINKELEIEINNIEINNITITNTKLNITKGNEIVEKNYEVNLVKSDLDNIINVINKVIKELQDNIEICFNYGLIEGKLVVDKDFNVSGIITLNNIVINLYFVDNIIYLNCGNVGVSGSVNDIIKIINELNIINLELDLNNIVEAITTSPNKINLKALGLDLEIDVNEGIYLVEKSKQINVSVNNTKDSPNSIKDINYVNINNLLTYLPIIKDLLLFDTYSFNVNSTVNDLKVEALININKELNIYADIYINDLINFKVTYFNEELIVKFNNNIVSIKLKELLSPDFALDINSLLHSLTFVDDVLTLGLNIFDNIINIAIDSKLNISISDFKINNILINNTTITTNISDDEIPTIVEEVTVSHDDLMFIKDNISSLMDLFSNTLNIKFNTKLIADTTKFTINVDLNVNFKDVVVSGKIDFITNSNLCHSILVYYEDDIIKLAYGNIGICLSVSEIDTILNKALTTFGLQFSDDSNINIYEIINSINVLVSDGINLNLELPMLGKLGININNNIITISDLFIKNIKLENNYITLNNGSIINNMPDINYLDYYDLNVILDLVDQLLKLTKENGITLNLNGNIKLNETIYNIVGNIYLTNNYEIKAVINIDDVHYIEVYRKYVDGNIMYYAIYDNLALNDSDENKTLNFMASEKDISELIDTISSMLNFDFSDIENGIEDIKGFNIVDIIDKVDFAKLVNKILLSEDLENKLLEIIINNGNDLLNVGIIIDHNNNLKSVEIGNLVLSDLVIESAAISLVGLFNDEIIVPELSYYDLNMLNPLVKTAFNTALLTDFNILGTFKITAKIANIPIDMTVPVEIKVKRIDGSVYPLIYAKFSDIPVILLANNDVPYVPGDTNGGEDRTLEIYYKDGFVYLYRHEKVSRFLQSKRDYKKKLKVRDEDFINNILYYLLDFGFGFSDDIMKAIYEGITINQNMDYTNVITNLELTENNTYNVGLNLAEITDNDMLDSVGLEVIPTTIGDNNYLSQLKFNMYMPLVKNLAEITISTDDLSLINIGTEVDLADLYSFVEGYSYGVNEFYESNSGDDFKFVETIIPTTPKLVLYLDNKETYINA